MRGAQRVRPVRGAQGVRGVHTSRGARVCGVHWEGCTGRSAQGRVHREGLGCTGRGALGGAHWEGCKGVWAA